MVGALLLYYICSIFKCDPWCCSVVKHSFSSYVCIQKLMRVSTVSHDIHSFLALACRTIVTYYRMSLKHPAGALWQSNKLSLNIPKTFLIMHNSMLSWVFFSVRGSKLPLGMIVPVWCVGVCSVIDRWTVKGRYGSDNEWIDSCKCEYARSPAVTWSYVKSPVTERQRHRHSPALSPSWSSSPLSTHASSTEPSPFHTHRCISFNTADDRQF